MSDRNIDYEFVSNDISAMEQEMITACEEMTGVTVQPSSPERLMIAWFLSLLSQQTAYLNYVGNQNIPSRAEGENLDALAQLYYMQQRPESTYAKCIVRFVISEPQASSVWVPAGTRVTDGNATVYWHTTEDAFVPIGASSIDLEVTAEVAGASGNGYVPGQINSCVDVFDYFDHCENTTESDGGSDTATDDEFFELLRDSQDAYASAGSRGAYIYFAKSVSTDIADVVASSPSAGCVDLYILMNDGTIANETIKMAVLDACSADEVRPLTDYVSVKDPEIVPYDIELTYYLQNGTELSAGEMQYAVEAGVQTFNAWQSAKLGRDINPSYLIQILMTSGIKRVDVVSPVFQDLHDGTDGTTPQLGVVRSIKIINGGYEDA